MNNKRQTGSLYEKKAAEYLEKQGLFILEKNYRCRSGEIDLIAKEDSVYVFVEVKFRRDNRAGDSLSAVHTEKQKKIIKTAEYYLMMHCHCMEVPCRFDVVGIDGKNIQWVKNAFEV